MAKQRREKNTNLLALTGAAALLAITVNFVINAHKKNRKNKDLLGSSVQINLSPSEILKLADRIISKSKEVHDAVASVPLDKVMYTNTLLPLAELEAQQFPLVQSCVFPKLVSTSEEVIKASAEAERRIDAHVSSCSKREDVYRVIKALAAKGEWMSPEAKHYAQCLVRDFERNGLSLTLTKRGELQRLKAQLDELSRRYIRNLNEDSTSLLFSETELVGLPPEFLKGLDKAESGKFKVTLRSHHVSPILELCKGICTLPEGLRIKHFQILVGLTRRIVAVAYGQRCDVNLPILESLVELRHKFARLLGFSNYSDYAVNQRMANSSSKVFEFLEDLSARLNDLATRELTMLKDLKKKEEGDFPLGVEDLLYYVKRAEEQLFNVDFEALKQYFPFDLVISGIFKICQDLFGLRFEEITDAEVWHTDVDLYSVYDLSSGELLGYFYLDMFSREGKYGHTCVVALQNGSFVNGERKISVALLITQLQKEVGGNARLLRFSEVVNLFHEFGHVVHHICNRASFARFSGLKLDPDFVEIPAQVLRKHLSEVDIWFLSGLFDQIIHSTENVDMVGLFEHLHPKVMLGLPMLEGTNPASCFPRTAIGYEAACYSRIWSEVFAADIFASKFCGDLSNQFAGMQFRNKVLAPGGAKDPVDILSDFLGREPSVQSFVDSKIVFDL